MTRKVQERPALSLPIPGSESSFVAQLQALFQEYGTAINDLLKAFEAAGTFTPTMTFATPGDLSVVYTIQDGDYWRVGRLLHFNLDISVTPTFTTSSGDLEIEGLPYPMLAAAPSTILSARVLGTGITWPASLTDVIGFIRAGDDSVQMTAQGSVSVGDNIKANDVTSGTVIRLLFSGIYPVDESSP